MTAHRPAYYGEKQLSFDDLLRSRLAEARIDAVALDAIVQQGSHDYHLEGQELDRFVRKMVGGLLSAGMVVVAQAPRGSNVDWVLSPTYQLATEEVILRLVHDWKHSVDGYAYFAWFTDPKNLNPATKNQ